MSASRPIRVLVCGGRNCNRAAVFNWLERFALVEIGEVLPSGDFHIASLIHGAGGEADEGGGAWGESEHIPVVRYPANWKRFGKAAGPKRNQQMADEAQPDVGIAFNGGRGTADMIRRLESAGIPVVRADISVVA